MDHISRKLYFINLQLSLFGSSQHVAIHNTKATLYSCPSNQKQHPSNCTNAIQVSLEFWDMTFLRKSI